MKEREFKKQYFILVIIAILVFFGFNGNISTLGLDESMYMTSSYEMVETGNWLSPQYNYKPFYDKPPLVYWLQAASFDMFDDFLGSKRLSDNTKIPFDTKLMLFRLPASLIGLCFLCAIVYFTRKLFGYKAAIYSGYAFALCILTAALGKLAIIDMILSFFIFMSLMLFLFVYLKKKPSYYMILSWAALGLAFLAKGPVAVGCVGIVVLGFLILKKKVSFLFTLPNLIGVLIFCGIALPWFFVMQKVSGGNFWYEFFIHQNLQRAAGQDFGHNYPVYTYVGIILIGMLPWSLYLIPAMFKSKFNNSNHVAETFLSTWIILIFVLFTSLVGKLPGYIFPLFAPSAILIGKYFSEYKPSNASKILSVFACIFSVILGAGFIAGSYLLHFQTIFAKTSLIISGLILIVMSIMATIKTYQNQNPVNYFKWQMAGFLVFFIISLFAITSNTKNALDEIDASYDLGTGAYAIAREFDVVDLPKYVKVIAYDLHPLCVCYPLIFQREIVFVGNETKLKKVLDNTDSYLLITHERADMPDNIKGELIDNNPKFTGKKHKYIFVKNY